MDYQTYDKLLTDKLNAVPYRGFDVPAVSPLLFDWQQAIVQQALRTGTYALFEECGSGKTLQFCEWAGHVQQHTGGYVLIVSPLAVAHQTIAEAAKLGLAVRYIRHQAEATAPGVYITNYDMLKAFDGWRWDGVVLDESSILKAYTGKTKQMILSMFAPVQYKLACSATPAPNDHLELGNHCEFLDIMPSNQMIQRWYINDSMQAGNYRLRKHGEASYWEWVTSWAVCLSTPSDLGYPDVSDRYSFQMPELRIHQETVEVDYARAQEHGTLFPDMAMSATGLWKEKRATLDDRCRRAADIVSTDEPWILWCDTDDEADALKRLFPSAVEVRGSQKLEEKERKLRAFGDGSVSRIITKPSIAGYGFNWQHCCKQVFVGVSYSFEKTYQALRRSWRFGQTRPVDAYLIYAESEGDIMQTLREKQEAHREMQRAMNAAMRTHGLCRQVDRRAPVRYATDTRMTVPTFIGAA